MGFFDDAAEAAIPGNNAVPGGSLAKPLIIAAGALLLRHMLSRKEAAPAPAPAQVPPPAPPGRTASVPDNDVIGGLGGLVDQFRRSGMGDVVDSWVTRGPNKPIDPGQLGQVVGQTTISDLARQLGVPEGELLKHLAQSLPGLVDKLTPNSRLPRPGEIAAGYRG
jgi:uncharacterized protein YidB (DUF937 family)